MSITEAKSESHLQHDYLVLQLTSGSAPTADRVVIAQQPEKASNWTYQKTRYISLRFIRMYIE